MRNSNASTPVLSWTRSPEGHYVAVDRNGVERFGVAWSGSQVKVFENDSVVGWVEDMKTFKSLKAARCWVVEAHGGDFVFVR